MLWQLNVFCSNESISERTFVASRVNTAEQLEASKRRRETELITENMKQSEHRFVDSPKTVEQHRN